jgi:hypothetical protein
MVNKALKHVRRLWKTFHLIFFSKKNLKRDAIILGTFCFILAMLFAESQYSFFSGLMRSVKNISQPSVIPSLSEEQIYEEVRTIQGTINTDNWKTYQSQWYGLEIKYPENWMAPTKQAASRGSKWEYRYQFRKYNMAEENPYIGFDVVIYAVAKIKELSNTEEFPSVISEQSKAEGQCTTIEGHIIETGDYPAEEIYIPPADNCYNTALFFSNTRGAYMYNIVPRFREGSLISGDPRVEITDNFPEFYSIISTFKLTDIVRPRLTPPERATSAPMPVSYRTVGGRLVCAKTNDHPGKSQKNKGRHLDMECCMDPDEYPNPNCYYPPDKYGKYLK